MPSDMLLVAVVLAIVVCLVVAGVAISAVRRAAREQSRWESVTSLATSLAPLKQVADALLSLLDGEISAQSWALYRYDSRHGVYQLVGVRGNPNPSSKTASGPGIAVESTATPLDGGSGDVPPTLSGDSRWRSLDIVFDRGMPVLNIPLVGEDVPAGIAQGFPVAPVTLTSMVKQALSTLQRPLGASLAAAEQREDARSRLADFEASSRVREVLLESTFSAQRLMENTLGVVMLSTNSTGAVVSLAGSATAGEQVQDRLFHAGDGREIVSSNFEAWMRVTGALQDVSSLSRSAGGEKALAGLAVHQVMVVSVNPSGQDMGSLYLMRRSEQPYGPEEVRLARAFADQVGRVVEQEEAYHSASEAYRGTLRTLVDLVDGRLPETVGHSSRVARWAMMVGREMQLSAEDLDTLRWSSLLHDVGMCSIGIDVLLTQGAITESEAIRVRQHPSLGALMAGPLQVPKPVGPGIRSHHERWDGRGYPDGLSGEEIPVQARIIAIAEVFNAYTSGRAYRDPKALSDALQIIQSESGKAFDPRVVDALGQALRGESAQFGCVSVGKPFLPRCFEQKGTPAELCARCPAYHSTQPCWSVAGVLCDRHGDRKCETCFIYTEAKWRSQLVGAPFADVRPIARTATGERDA